MNTVYIKNMVCERCITVVKDIFSRSGYPPTHVSLGEVTVKAEINDQDYVNIQKSLQEHDFELIDQSSPILILKIKAALTSLFTSEDISEDFKLSQFLTKKFPYDYSHMSRVFSQHEGDTLEHFLIKLRIERAKELLSYKDHNVSEVAYKLGYASAAHFSRQFKKIVGTTPSNFQKNPSVRNSLGRL